MDKINYASFIERSSVCMRNKMLKSLLWTYIEYKVKKMKEKINKKT